jgi:hypothetical protein
MKRAQSISSTVGAKPYASEISVLLNRNAPLTAAESGFGRTTKDALDSAEATSEFELEKVCEARRDDPSELAAEQVSEHRAQALELLAEVSAELVKLPNARAMGASARDNDPKGRR